VNAAHGTVFWTSADAAELDLLVGELVDTIAFHRDHCPVCSAASQWCDPLRGCFDEIVAWRDWRVRQTRARALRVKQEAADWLRRVKEGNAWLDRDVPRAA
jgi:hypothetical protein